MKKYYLFEMKMKDINIICIIISIILVTITFIINPIEYIDYISLIILLIPYFFLHEIIHSISYVLCGASFKNITYGAHLEKGILCCLCKQNISKTNILISLLAPLTLIGIITYIIGIIINNDLLILLSIMNIAGSSGDLLMFYNLCRLNNFSFSEYDNPMAFALYSKENLSKKKFYGLKYIGNTMKLKKTMDKKVNISKPSIIIFIIILIIGIIKNYC